MIVLGIETSCDETAAAIVEDGINIISSIVSSQVDIHHKYGGVVPELACRNHIKNINRVIESAFLESNKTFEDIDLVSVTTGPGLVGAILVGLSAAKAIAYSNNLPLASVNHLEGHLLTIFLEKKDMGFPYLSLIISGGHTNIYLVKGFGSYSLLAQTLDDAAGEAYDKVSKMMGLGYPGGKVIECLALKGDSSKITFPRAMPGSQNFSFSGLKTSVRNVIISDQGYSNEDIAAGFQQAVIDVLIKKLKLAVKNTGVTNIVISGGVASNNVIRTVLAGSLKEEGITCLFPDKELCTDNAAMIACAGYFKYLHKEDGNFNSYLDLDADISVSL